MYKTVEEAREAAKRFVGKYDVNPMITESKQSERARSTTFGFNFPGKDAFNPEWVKDQYGWYHRMIERVE